MQLQDPLRHPILMVETPTHHSELQLLSVGLVPTSIADKKTTQLVSLEHVTAAGLPQGLMQMNVIQVNLLRGSRATAQVLSQITVFP